MNIVITPIMSKKIRVTAKASSSAETESTMSFMGKDVSELYKDKKLKEQILDDPETFAGSIDPQTENVWCYDEENNKMYKDDVTFTECFFKIFDEVLVNSIDQHHRLITKIKELPDNKIKPVKRISVNVDEKKGTVCVENDGEGLDVVMHAKHGKYVPEVVFGNLLTSVNYDKTEKRTVGGKNGVGAKITNIFSKEFIIETVDWRRKLHYKQVFRDNMNVVEEPVITKYTKVPYTRITYTPDFKRFGVKKPESMGDWKLIKRRVVDASACTDRSVSIYLNGKKIETKEFEDYVNLYIGAKGETKRVFSAVNDRWQVAVCLSPNGEFDQVSFVNGIFTDEGGRHVNHVVDSLARKLVASINSGKNKVDVKPAFIKSNLMVFIKATIENPKFNTQTKRKLTSLVEHFGSKCDLDDAFVVKVTKLGILQRAQQLADFKAKTQLNKTTDGNARARKVYHPKLIDARAAGPRRKKMTTIVFTEGDSAANFMAKGLKGIPDKEHQYWGYFPLRGKLLNIRKATISQLKNNEEIKMIKQIIGLKEGEDYSDTKNLRYDRVMILADADKDGHHIKGLLMNLFSAKWPSLMKIPGFLCDLATPINKVMKTNARNKVTSSIDFFSEDEFKKWMDEHNHGRGWEIMYYKGLGTYEPNDAKKLCGDMKITNYVWDSNPSTSLPNKDVTEHSFELAFEKSYEDARKEWLNNNAELEEIELQKVNDVTFPHFIDNKLKQFSIADNVRSIPSMVDGFKPSQRKVLFSCLKRNLTKRTKVASLAGYVAEHSAYHHGEASLNSTIVSMAQDFVGSGNVNLLYPSGSFGSRMGGGRDNKLGDDAAASRYIFTFLNNICKALFSSHDDALLEFLTEEGQSIEPAHYLPTLPLILLNGTIGLGTGYSTSVPCYNPEDVVVNIKRYLSGEPMTEMLPWYRGFKGKITKLNEGQYLTTGCWKALSDTKIRITELPTGSNNCKSFKGYIEFLNNLMGDGGAKKEIQVNKKTGKVSVKKTQQQDDTSSTRSTRSTRAQVSIKDYDIIKATDTELIVEVTFDADVLEAELANSDEFAKKMKLSSTISTRNMHLYDINGQIKKYDTAEDIIREFCDVRKGYYEKRRSNMITAYKHEHSKLSAKYRFVNEIMDEIIDINRKTKGEAEEILSTADPSYPKMDESYDYLLNMKVISFTKEKLAELQKEKDKYESLYTNLEGKTGTDIWNEDLDNFSREWKLLVKDWSDVNGF